MSLYRAGTPARVYLGGQLARAVYRGTVEVWRRDPLQLDNATGELVVPSWAALFDYVLLGGGGGGQGGNGANSRTGTGGAAGQWLTGTVAVVPGQRLRLAIGAAGLGGAKSAPDRIGTAGGATTLTLPDGRVLTAPGGAAGTGFSDTPGASPGTRDYQGIIAVGGVQAGANQDGHPPGGGGGPGTGGIFGGGNAGRNAGPGRAWGRWRSY